MAQHWLTANHRLGVSWPLKYYYEPFRGKKVQSCPIKGTFPVTSYCTPKGTIFCTISESDWMEADLKVSLQSTVKKGLGVSGQIN